MFLHAEEDVYTRSDWTGRRRLQSEVRDSLTLGSILLVVQGRTICLEYQKCSIGASAGRSWSPIKNTNSRRGGGWTVLKCPVHLV